MFRCVLIVQHPAFYRRGLWNSDDGNQRGNVASLATARAVRTVTRTSCAIPAYRNDGWYSSLG
jgi:hypothetical protein